MKDKLTNADIYKANALFIIERKKNINNKSILHLVIWVIGLIMILFCYLLKSWFNIPIIMSLVLGLILIIYGWWKQKYYDRIYEQIGTKEEEESFDRAMPNYRRNWIVDYNLKNNVNKDDK